MSPLGQRILKHWQEFRPKYVESLKQQGKLYQTAQQAAFDHAETFSTLRSRPYNLAFDQAEELAREPWISPESQAAKEPDQAT